MSFEKLVSVIHRDESQESWKECNQAAFDSLLERYYRSRAEKVVKLRAPEMQDESGVSYAAYIHSSNTDKGPYAGMSFVVFPHEHEACLIGMVVGTQGLAPDETILGRPGHARKMQAICTWLNQEHGKGTRVAWAKQDPTQTEIDVPSELQADWSEHERVFKRYGKVLYALFRPTSDRSATLAAVTAMLDVMFEERKFSPLERFRRDADEIKRKWFAHLMPAVSSKQVTDLLQERRFVILQGPPGTGKTHMAGAILKGFYRGVGKTIQFHPNTTYENFVGGLAPVVSNGDGSASLGFQFRPLPGFLMEAASAAMERPNQPYLLHVDEINRADLGKVLGEAIYLLEPRSPFRREISLPYDFGNPFGKTFYLPDNLHILGTMNSSDRSIAIVDLAVRRRFGFVSLWPSIEVVSEHGCELTVEAFQRITSVFVENATDETLSLLPGHSYFMAKDTDAAKRDLRSNLAPLLREYLTCGYVAGFAEEVRSYLQWLESQ